MLSKFVNRLIRKEIIIAVVIFLIVLIYLLFFKTNPKVRVDWNKFVVKKSNSSLTLEAPESVGGVGKRFVVNVKLDTKGYWVNAVQSYLRYDPKALEIESLDTSSSFCKFYPENNYSNKDGMVKLVCGTPYPGFKGKNTVQSIEFMTKAIKHTEISLLKESKVLANDGKGTNLLTDFDAVIIRVAPSI